MKLLIAVALFAVACAEVQVVNLPRAPVPEFQVPDIRPLFVPAEVIEAIKLMQPVVRDAEVFDDLRVNFVDALLDAPVEEVAHDAEEDLKIHFVDFVADEAVEDNAAAYAVNFVDVPLTEEVAALATEEIYAPEKFDEGLEPNFVEVAEEIAAPASEDIPADAVRFVDSPLTEEVIAPVFKDIPADAVKFVDTPLAESVVPEPVVLAGAPLPAYETAEPAVEAVKIGVPRFPGKQFADPRLR